VASANQKKPAAKKKSAGKQSSASKRPAEKKPVQAQKRPIRREVGGLILLVLALCTLVSYFGVNALLVDWLAKLLKGLFGYGYWLSTAAMLYAALILLNHRGRPVRLRITCALLLPVVFAMLSQMAFSDAAYESLDGILKTLWTSGQYVSSGGVIAGLLAIGSVKVLSKWVSLVVFVLLFAVMLMTAMNLSLGMIIEMYRERARYEEEPEEEVARTAVPPAPKRRPAEVKTQIDVPLDSDFRRAVVPEKKKEEGRFTSFFRHKSEHQKTPDQVLNEKGTEKAAPPAVPETVAAETAPVPAPAAELKTAAPATASRTAAPAPLPIEEETVSPRKEKATTAKEVAAQTAAVTAEIEEKLAAEEDVYQFPPITLLHQNSGENHIEAGAELRNNSRRLAETLTSFGVDAKPGDVVHGPSVTRYEFTLDQGVKLSKVTNLADDIALALGATGVRIAPIPDKISVVGIEVPNKQVTSVLIRDVIESRDFTEHKSNTAFSLGRDIGGRNVIGDIEKLPHVLIAGTTGSGKSVCTNSLIISLLYKSTPDQVRFIMVDPKMVELAPYNGIPHLLIPVVTDPKKAAGALQWAVFEMMKRYKTFSEHGVKKLEEYNRLARTSEELSTLPSVVVVIDELADLMLVAAKEVEESICRVAQMGRAAGVHLVIATQRPSADVITGLMKANIPSRIAFAVASSLESRIILDTTGAEKLVGKGDMLYAPLGAGKPQRVQGCFISPEEIEDVVQFVKQSGETRYDNEVIAKIEQSIQEKEKGSSAKVVETAEDNGDELLPAAVEVVLETGQASVSMLQRRLKLGYSRAARLVDQMEERGIVGPFEGSKPRQLLITRAQWQEMQMGSAPAADTDDETVLLSEEEV